MRQAILIISFVVLAMLIAGAAFTVQQTEQALVLRFGRIVRTVEDPGLYFKVPMIDATFVIDKRILSLDMTQEEVIAADRKRLVVDAFARYRIVNPSLFYRTVGDLRLINSRLQPALSSTTRNLLGEQTLAAVLSEKRAALMLNIRDILNEQAKEWGIEVVDVRIRRADLPEANSQSIYDRMNSERQQEAAQIRAEGQEESLKIRAEADRQVTVTLAEARRDADIIRGDGDAQRNKIFADAYGRDPQFFDFYRSMRAYETALTPETTTLMLKPDSDFFRYFGERNR